MTPPAALREALERGTITQEQIRELIACEADELGLSYDEALELARRGAMPASPLGSDIEFLVELLAA
jgi:hypothetical protein